MQDKDKTKEQFISELHELRERVAELEKDKATHKRDEELLQAHLHRFYSVLSSLHAGILLVTEDRQVEFANRSFCDLFDLECSPEELRGLSPSEMIERIQSAYADPVAEVNRIEEILDRDLPMKGEEVALRDGRTCLRDFIPLDIEGKRYGRLWHHQDITERKQSEEALQQSEREKAILNQIANVFLTSADERIYGEVLAVILNALKCRYGIFGYIGDSGDLIIPSMTKEIWSDCQVEGKSIVFPRHQWGNSLWGRAIKEKESFSSEGPFQTPEGHLPVHNFLTVPIVFADRTIGLVSVANKDRGFTVEDKTVLERIAGNISPILSTDLVNPFGNDHIFWTVLQDHTQEEQALTLAIRAIHQLL